MHNTLSWREAAGASFSQRVDGFSKELRQRSTRLAELRCGTAAAEERLRDALMELQSQYDDLLAVEAELRAQLEHSSDLAIRSADEQNRARQLFDLAPDPALETDANGIIRDANRRAIALMGAIRAVSPRTHGLVLGRPLPVFVDKRDRLALREKLIDLRSAEEGTIDFRLAVLSGEEVVVSARVCRGGGTGLLWSLRVRPAEERPPRDVEPTVDIRRRLRDAQEIAAFERTRREHVERSECAKDRFLSALSHDLRGPIHAVLGWAQLMRRECLDRTARDDATAVIERSARFQLALLDELLDVTRVGGDELRIEVKMVDLGALARQILEGFAPIAAEKGIDLQFLDTGGPHTVFGDPRRLEQITTKLLTNAFHFTSAGGSVELGLGLVDNARVRIRVRDDGRGIEPERAARMFDAYAQLDTEAAPQSGLGVDLFLVRHFVELHGGTVEAQSDGVGHGTTVNVYLPVYGITGAGKTESPMPHVSEMLDGVQILVVEDDNDTRELMSTILAMHGAEVAQAGDVAGALTLFERRVSDFVISDLEIGGEDGCALLLPQLRQRRPGIPAIAVSGLARPKDADRALDAGFDAFLAKPVSPDQLVAVVRTVAALRSKTRR